MNPEILFAILAGLYGLAIGSFLNVCTLRWPQDQSVVKPRSRCPQCALEIGARDNIPVISWILLRGKCRGCGLAISIQYPLVELATGMIWAAMFWIHGPSWEAARGGILLTILFGIAISDARFYIIPNEFSIGGMLIGVALAVAPGGIDLTDSLIGAAVGYGALWLIGTAGTWLVRKTNPGRLEEAGVDSALGGGDVKMMAMVGAFLGAWGVALTVFIGSLVALIVFGAISAITKRLIPLGIFLAVGAAIAYGWGEAIRGWYFGSVLGL